MTSPHALLSAAKSVLLVDWEHPGVARALLEAGLTVYSHSPDGVSVAALVDVPSALEVRGSYPTGPGETGTLEWRALPSGPDHVDIVNVFRPADELPAIVETLVLPVAPKVLWLHPPIRSEEAARLAGERGMAFVEDVDMAAVAREVGGAAR